MASRFTSMIWFVGLFGSILLSSSRSNAETFGGIEIGAKGIKFTVVEATPTPEGTDLKVVGSGSANATLVMGLAKDGNFAPEALKEAGNIVTKFLGEIKEKHMVKMENIFLVGSSGIFSPIEKMPDAVKANQEILAKAMFETSSLKMDFIDARREAELSIKGMVPTKFRDESILIDIGSGNTKGGYQEPEGKFVTFAAPFGTTSFATQVSAAGGSFVEKLNSLKESALVPALHKELQSSENFAKRNRVYLSGGIAYATVTLTHFEKKRVYIPITPKLFDDLEARLLKDPTAFPAPDLSTIPDEGWRMAVSKEVERVKGIYKPEQLLAGVQILKVIASELEIEKQKKSLFFVRDGHLGWITAYVSEKVK